MVALTSQRQKLSLNDQSQQSRFPCTSHWPKVTELYGIKGIPQIILFAPDGTIIKRDLRGAAMKALVEESLK